MKPFRINLFLYALAVFACVSCKEGVEESDGTKIKDTTLRKITETTPFLNPANTFPATKGIIGVYDVPEMLCLSITDSAAMKDVSTKVANNYVILQEESESIIAESLGTMGQISYNNNPENFKFECILLLKKMPPKEPKRCKIIILEESSMLVYNFYGSYQKLYTAYDLIRKACELNKLKQSGAIREFYITDPTIEKDSEKWLTRIMVPVTQQK